MPPVSHPSPTSHSSHHCRKRKIKRHFNPVFEVALQATCNRSRTQGCAPLALGYGEAALSGLSNPVVEQGLQYVPVIPFASDAPWSPRSPRYFGERMESERHRRPSVRQTFLSAPNRRMNGERHRSSALWHPFTLCCLYRHPVQGLLHAISSLRLCDSALNFSRTRTRTRTRTNCSSPPASHALPARTLRPAAYLISLRPGLRASFWLP